MNFKAVYNTFARTKYGKTLAKNIRYAIYKPDKVSNEEWETLLGDDVNNLRHLWVSYEITKNFMNADPDFFTEEEREYLLLTAVTHDWAESVVGDIMQFLKTKDDENKEILCFRNLLDDLVKNKTFDKYFSDKIKKKVFPVLTDIESKLGRAFNAIERNGYVITGLRAYQATKENDLFYQDNLQSMAKSVMYGHIAYLVDYATEFTYVKKFLKKNANKVSEVFDSISDEFILKITPMQRDTVLKKKTVVLKKWEEFKK